MKASLSRKLILPAMALIFSAPMLISWWMLNRTEYGQTNAGASHGDLITPPRPLQDAQLRNLSGSTVQGHLYGKWSLAYLHAGECADACIGNLYKMRQVRLATGEYAPRIQRVLVLGVNENPPEDKDLLKYFPGQLLLLAAENRAFSSLKMFGMSAEEEPLSQGRLYLIDPLGNLMMSYPPGAEPGGIIKDLKRLLRYSRIG